MEKNLFLVQLALIFVPGIIWASVHRRFCSKKQIGNFDFVILTFMFGSICYAVDLVGYGLFEKAHPFQAMLAAGKEDQLPKLGSVDLFFAALTSLILSIIWTFGATYKWDVRFLQSIRATKRFGDEDVWDFTFNSNEVYVEYVQVRDFEKKIVYSGWVNTFSETEKLRELLLRDVEVHDFDGNFLYRMPYTYIARDPADVQIDFPYSTASSNQGSQINE